VSCPPVLPVKPDCDQNDVMGLRSGGRAGATIWLCSRGWGGFFDAEDDVVLATLDRLQPVARHSDQMGDVDLRQRVGAAHFKPIARRQGSQGLARLERRKRAFQPGQIQFSDGHERGMR
jgi:hypothetical protein